MPTTTIEPTDNAKLCQSLHAQGLTTTQIIEKTGLSRPVVLKHVARTHNTTSNTEEQVFNDIMLGSAYQLRQKVRNKEIKQPKLLLDIATAMHDRLIKLRTGGATNLLGHLFGSVKDSMVHITVHNDNHSHSQHTRTPTIVNGTDSDNHSQDGGTLAPST